MAGRRVSDGKATDVVIPDSTQVDDFELVRVAGVNGFVYGVTSSTDNDEEKTKAIEIDCNAIFEIHVPSGVNPSKGTCLYWTTPGSFQYGPSHLRATPANAGDAPCFFVTKARVQGVSTNYLVQGRVLNGHIVGTT